MVYSGPITLDELIDLDSMYADGGSAYTFFAFPASLLNEHGVPDDKDAQEYIAAVQSAGVPIGFWRPAIVKGTVYAGVTNDSIPMLKQVIENLTQFPTSYASDLSERLFRESTSDAN